jgi:exonuclease SbcC
MRILRIRGENLASLEAFDVDFAVEPLASAGLFAIVGPTGSGKSTILDALCVALYDRTPRLAERGGVALRDVGRATIAANDVRSLLRRGAGHGFAEVTFTGRDGKAYVARWEVQRAHKNPRGRLQEQTLSLVCQPDGQAIGSHKKGETLEEIEDRVGLSFFQFRRAVLLAQGEFAALLKSDDRQRAELLERMTETEIYGEISKQSYLEATKRQEVLRQLEDEKQRIGALSDQDRADLIAQAGEAARQSVAATAEEQAAQSASTWHEARRALAGDVDSARRLAEDARAALDDAAPLGAELDDVDAVQPGREPLGAADRGRRESEAAAIEASQRANDAQCAADHDAAAATKAQLAASELDGARAAVDAAAPDLAAARALDVRIADAETRRHQLAAEAARKRKAEQAAAEAVATHVAGLVALDAAVATEDAWLAAHAADRQVAERWPGWQPLLDDAMAVAARRPAAEKEAATASKARADAETRHVAALAAEAPAADTHTLSEQNAANAEAACDPSEAKAIADERAAADARLDRLTQLEPMAREARERASQIEEQQTRSIKARAAAGDALRRIDEGAAEAKALAPRIKEAEGALGRIQASLSLADHRTDLRDGDACPLCGALDHPFAHGAAPGRSLEADQRAHVKALRAQLAASQEAVAGATVAEREARERAERADGEAARSGGALAGLRTRWRALATTDLPDDPTTADVSLPIASAREARAAAVERASAWDGRIAEALSARAAAQKALQDAERARSAVVGAERDAFQATQRAERARSDADALSTRLDEVAERLPELDATRVRETPGTLAESLAATASAWTGATARRERHADTRDQTLNQRDLAMQAHADASRAAGEAASAEALQVGNVAELRAQRAPLLGGRAAAEVEAELQARRRRAESEQAAAAAAATTATANAAAARARSEEAGARVLATKEASRLADERLAEVLAELDVGLETLRERLAHDAAWLSARRKHLTDLARAAEVAAARVTDRDGALAAHDARGTPPFDEAKAAEVSRAAGARRKAADERVGTLANRLATDDRQREQELALASRIAELKDEQRVWDELQGLIGSADGKRFRTFAQSLTLDRLVELANGHLTELSRRYRLERVRTSDLDLQIVDQDMGDEIRSLNTLSGGELFLVSLALALGLASLSSKTTSIESLFIDEGFGTLDPQTLDQAVSALEGLQATGRKVGLISHVQGLAERLGVQVRLSKKSAGRSQVEITRLASP